MENKCCDKCSGVIRDENSFARDYGCLRDTCPCHSQESEANNFIGSPGGNGSNSPVYLPNTGSTSQESEAWEKQVADFYWEDESLSRPEKLISFIRTFLAKEREEACKRGQEDSNSNLRQHPVFILGYKDGQLELLGKIKLEKKHDFTFRHGASVARGYNQAVEDLKALKIKIEESL